MAKKYRYTVEGSYDFPVDMLRYDAAYPSDGHSVTEITASVRHEPGTPRTHRTIHLVSDRPPTIDRWVSFGWFVPVNRIGRL